MLVIEPTKGRELTHWSQSNWTAVEANVRRLQGRLYRAAAHHEHGKVKNLQKLMVRSMSAKLKAIRQVTQENSGKHTPGIDGVVCDTPQKRLELLNDGLRLKGYRPQPVKRHYRPKRHGGQRPFGIPTQKDRVMQAMGKLALEPEWESRFEANSYGFRPGRSTMDAITAIHTAMSRKNGSQWVLDADITGCFDNLDHTTLLTRLPVFTTTIRRWLKAGVMEGGRPTTTEAGTPQGGVRTPLTKLQAFFFGGHFPREGIHPKDHLHLVYPDLDPPDERAQQLALALPFQFIQVLRHLSRERVQAPHNQLEFSLQRFRLGELLTLRFDLDNTLTQPCHPWLACLLFNQALSITIDKPGQSLSSFANLTLQGCTLLSLPLAIGGEATGKLLGESFRMRQEGAHFLPHRPLQAIRPHRSVGAEAVAAKAIGIGAETPGIRIGSGPPFPRAGTQGFAVEGRATVLTWAEALEQRACPALRLAGMTAVFLPLLLHDGKHLGFNNGGHCNMHPVCGRHIIVRHGPPWLQRSVPLWPEFWAQRALARLAESGAAHRGRIGPQRPDDPALPHGAPCPRPFARLHEPTTDFADGEPLAANPRKDLADDAGFVGDEVIARLAPAVMLTDRAIAIRRATEHIDRPGPGGMEFAPAVALKDLGPFVCGHPPLHLEAQIVFWAAP
jgi:retron-type reverse transcriptase